MSPRRLSGLSVATLVLTVISALAISFAQDVAKDYLPRWAVYAVIVAGGAASVALLLLRRRSRPPVPVRFPDAPLPPRVDLVGRDELVGRAADVLRRSHLLLLHGPRNIGTSAVALEVAFRVVPDESAHVYVDLRSREADKQEDAASTKLRVLTALGLEPARGPSDADVREQVRRALTGTGRVLVLDNVRSAEQVGWLTLPVLGAYVLAAGDVPPQRGLPDLAVRPLAPADGLALLRRDGPADRLPAEDPDVRKLAAGYLRSPAVVLAVRAWLQARPTATVADLLDELTGRGDPARTEPSQVLRTVLSLQTAGLSPDAAALFALLPSIPVTFVGVEAVAALLDRAPQRAERALDELARRALVDAEAGSYRIPGEARRLGQSVRPRTLRAASARLLGWYAGVASARIGMLQGPHETEPEAAAAARAWFGREDLALLALLGAVRRATVPASAARSVARIADALDVWFARQRRPEQREAAAGAALAAAQELGDRAGQETALLRLAVVARIQGRLDEAADTLARVRARVSGPAAEARLAAASGALSLVTGDLATARQDFESTLRSRPPADAVGAAVDRVNLGAALLAQGDLDRAVDRLREAAALAADAADSGTLAHAQELLGVVAARRGRLDDALEVWSYAELVYAGVPDDPGRARCRLHIGTVLAGRDPEAARTALTGSLELRDTRTGVGVALAHAQLAELAGDPQEAAEHEALGMAALAPWEGRIDPPFEVTALRLRLAGADSTA